MGLKKSSTNRKLMFMNTIKLYDKILDKFYIDNMQEIDQKFEEYCFYSGNFEHRDQKKMFNNDDVFWEFVLTQFEKRGLK